MSESTRVTTRITVATAMFTARDCGKPLPVDGVEYTIRAVHNAYSVEVVPRAWWHRPTLCRLLWRWR